MASTPQFFIKNIGLWQASFAVSPETLEQVRNFLTKIGVGCITTSRVLRPHTYLAATDQERAQELHDLLDNPQVDIVMAARGGYGSARMLPYIDWDFLRHHTRPIVGYSDLTAFFLAMQARGLDNAFFGPMLSPVATKPEYQQYFSSALSRLEQFVNGILPDENLIPGPMAEPGAVRVLKTGRARGKIVPANFTVLSSLIGTPWLPDLSGCILLLEDVDEAAYRIDRMLNQLRQTGILAKLSALIFGQFTDCENGHFLPEILAEYATFVPGPVLSGFTFGHIPDSLVVPCGHLIEINAENGIFLKWI